IVTSLEAECSAVSEAGARYIRERVESTGAGVEPAERGAPPRAGRGRPLCYGETLMRSLTRFALLAAVVVTCVGCDQATKAVASRELAGKPPVALWAGMVQLSYQENPGAFLSLGAGLPRRIRTMVFEVLTSCLLAGLLAFAAV